MRLVWFDSVSLLLTHCCCARPTDPPTQVLSLEDERYADWWAFGDRLGLYAMCHLTAVTTTAVVSRLAEKYPGVSWVIAHSGQSWGFAEDVAACVAGAAHGNVYAELTYTAVTNRVVEYLVGATDAGHVLFGTDAPMRDPRPQLGWVVWADLPSEDRLRIVGANFDGILARAGGGVADGC